MLASGSARVCKWWFAGGRGGGGETRDESVRIARLEFSARVNFLRGGGRGWLDKATCDPSVVLMLAPQLLPCWLRCQAIVAESGGGDQARVRAAPLNQCSVRERGGDLTCGVTSPFLRTPQPQRSARLRQLRFANSRQLGSSHSARCVVTGRQCHGAPYLQSSVTAHLSACASQDLSTGQIGLRALTVSRT